jgi:hypothetical protein
MGCGRNRPSGPEIKSKTLEKNGSSTARMCMTNPLKGTLSSIRKGSGRPAKSLYPLAGLLRNHRDGKIKVGGLS